MWIHSLLSGNWIRDKVRRSPQYQEAVRFANDYKPKDGKDYKWILEHASKEFEMVSRRVDGLDAKADTLIGYLGAGSGLISLSLTLGVNSHPRSVLSIAVPTLALLLAAMLCALISRAPSRLPSLPYTRDALTETDGLASGAEGKFSAQIWMSSAALSLAIREKARLVRIAFWLFGTAIIWLVISVIVWQPVLRH